MTAQQRVFAAAYFGGLLILLGGVALQVLWRFDALVPGLILWGFTRIGLSVWQWLVPEVVFGSIAPKGRLLFTIAAWTLIVVLLVMVEISK